MRMKRTVVILFVVIVLSVLASFDNVSFVKARVLSLSPSVIYVPGNFSTIQAAINNATAGDTILVASGMYKEQITINKPLQIIGEDRSNTTIDAGGAGYVVKITSSNVTLSGFTIQNITTDPTIAWGGIWLSSVSKVTIANCTVTKCLFAVWFSTTRNNTFRGNEFTGNLYDFGFMGESPKYFVQDMDTSNTVNGKPVYWWVKQHNLTVPSDAGMVAAVNCTNITVKDLAFANNGRSVLFVSTNDSAIENVTVSNSYVGIATLYSNDNRICNNTVSDITQFGIVLTYSNNNTVHNNNVSRCGYNLKLVTSHQNRITANTLTHSPDMYGLMLDAGCLSNYVADNVVSFNKQGGIGLDDQGRWNTFFHNFVEGNTGADGGLLLFDGSSDNLIVENTFLSNSYGVKAASFENTFTCKSTIYKNNFLYNTIQTYHDVYTKNHTWDNGAEGNYWGFAGPDVNKDGISDSSYTIDAYNVDRYPLMEPWSRSRTYTVTVEGRPFYVNMVSNSTIGGFNFDQTKPNPHIAFNVTGPVGARGFCNVTIPKVLLNATPTDKWIITIDGIIVTPTQSMGENGTHTFFYLVYDFSTHQIQIIGTDAYPEFPVPAMLLLTLVFVFLSVAVLRRKRH
jgi:parallel beta-helix repeat protein